MWALQTIVVFKTLQFSFLYRDKEKNDVFKIDNQIGAFFVCIHSFFHQLPPYFVSMVSNEGNKPSGLIIYVFVLLFIRSFFKKIFSDKVLGSTIMWPFNRMISMRLLNPLFLVFGKPFQKEVLLIFYRTLDLPKLRCTIGLVYIQCKIDDILMILWRKRICRKRGGYAYKISLSDHNLTILTEIDDDRPYLYLVEIRELLFKVIGSFAGIATLGFGKL